MAILITGGSSGLGRGVALRFAQDGADVFVNYHADDDAANETAEAVRQAGGTPHLLKVDVGSIEGCRELIAKVRESTDRLDQIVHAAALTAGGPLLETDPDELNGSVAVNGMALIHLTREALPLLDRGSSIFFLTSRGARLVIPNYGALGIAKALAEHIVRYLAVELAPKGIRVNSVSPGAVDTKAFRSMFPDTYEQRLEAAAKANPSGRGITIEEAAGLVWMLAQPECQMVQGQTLTIDGGVSL